MAASSWSSRRYTTETIAQGAHAHAWERCHRSKSAGCLARPGGRRSSCAELTGLDALRDAAEAPNEPDPAAMYQAALRQTERATEKVSKLPAIEFIASICKVQTLADGGIRLTLDLPEDAIAEAAMLMQIRQAGEVLTVHAWAGERAKSQTKQLGDLSQ